LVRLGQQDTSHPGTDLDFAGTLDLGGYLNGLGEGTDFNDLRIDRQGRHRRGHHRLTTRDEQTKGSQEKDLDTQSFTYRHVCKGI